MPGDGPSVAVAGVDGSSWRAGVAGSAVRVERARLGAIVNGRRRVVASLQPWAGFVEIAQHALGKSEIRSRSS
eukprot:scaffold41159_cov57-Phaeocystis_antarctica.AAC.2